MKKAVGGQASETYLCPFLNIYTVYDDTFLIKEVDTINYYNINIICDIVPLQK